MKIMSIKGYNRSNYFLEKNVKDTLKFSRI